MTSKRVIAPLRRSKVEAKHPSEYAAWIDMRQRCNNPRHRYWQRYGGRGIKVCPTWDHQRGGFEQFLLDMGEKPTFRHSIDRRDNDLGYDKNNCRWSTMKVQQNNRCNNRILTVGSWRGKIVEAVEIFGISRNAVHWRLSEGWSERDACMIPQGLGQTNTIVTRRWLSGI
jgi:hypothetical protein